MADQSMTIEKDLINRQNIPAGQPNSPWVLPNTQQANQAVGDIEADLINRQNIPAGQPNSPWVLPTMTGDNLQPQPPINLDPVVPTPLSQVVPATTIGNSIDNYLAPDSQYQQPANDLMASLTTLMPELANKTSDTISAENAAGLPDLNKQLRAAQSEIDQMTIEADKQQKAIMSQGGDIGLNVATAQQRQSYENYVFDLNMKKAKVNASMGNVEFAQQQVDRAITQKYSPIEQKIDIQFKQLQMIMPFLSADNAKLAHAQDLKLADEKARLKEEKTKAKENINLAFSGNVQSQFVNKNGEFFDARTGQGFATPQDFFKAAGVNGFEQAYQRGLVTDLTPERVADIDYVSQLRTNFPDAGIRISDSPATAEQKLQNSKMYQEQFYHANTGGSGGGGLTPGQINATVNTIAGAFDNEPIVKNYNTAQEGYQTLQKIGVNTSSPADDIAFIYAFAKIMDPNSVVREGEYNTIQRYAQTWADTFGFTAKRIFSNTNFISADAKKKMMNALTPKVETLTQQYQKVQQEYQRQINDAYQGLPRSITDYSVGSASGGQQPDMTPSGLNYTIEP